MTIEKTLSERGNTYGTFESNAELTQKLKDVVHNADGWDNLTYAQREAIEMVFHKFSRIINGNPNFHDSWHDAIGYLSLIERSLDHVRV